MILAENPETTEATSKVSGYHITAKMMEEPTNRTVLWSAVAPCQAAPAGTLGHLHSLVRRISAFPSAPFPAPSHTWVPSILLSSIFPLRHQRRPLPHIMMSSLSLIFVAFFSVASLSLCHSQNRVTQCRSSVVRLPPLASPHWTSIFRFTRSVLLAYCLPSLREPRAF